MTLVWVLAAASARNVGDVREEARRYFGDNGGPIESETEYRIASGRRPTHLPHATAAGGSLRLLGGRSYRKPPRKSGANIQSLGSFHNSAVLEKEVD
jgi:hypothetical protein